MIFPWLEGIRFFSIPVTWFLVLLNTLLFLFTNPMVISDDAQIDLIASQDYYSDTQGVLFSTFVHRHPQSFDRSLQSVAAHAVQGETSSLEIMSISALRDHQFMAEYSETSNPDPVASKFLKKGISQIKTIQNSDPLNGMGFFKSHTHLVRWITYIFAHGSAMHLIGNMFFLLLIGGYLERREGGLLVLLVFLGAGMIGALSYALLTGISLAPLIGASAAVSGLMGYLCSRFITTRVPFFYWLFLPGNRYSGLVLLPTWILFLYWGLADLAGYFSSSSLSGGVAYSAHLGGEIFGLILGLTMLGLLRLRTQISGAVDLVGNP